MIAIFRREIKNYLKRPLFWIGVLLVIYGVFNAIQVLICIHVILQRGRKSPMISPLFLMRVKCMRGIYRQIRRNTGNYGMNS